jgi:hypothetical protein
MRHDYQRIARHGKKNMMQRPLDGEAKLDP